MPVMPIVHRYRGPSGAIGVAGATGERQQGLIGPWIKKTCLHLVVASLGLPFVTIRSMTVLLLSNIGLLLQTLRVSDQHLVQLIALCSLLLYQSAWKLVPKIAQAEATKSQHHPDPN